MDEVTRRCVGANLRALRSKAKLTQDKFRVLLGVTQGTLSRFESGSIPVAQDSLKKASEEAEKLRGYGIDPAWLSLDNLMKPQDVYGTLIGSSVSLDNATKRRSRSPESNEAVHSNERIVSHSSPQADPRIEALHRLVGCFLGVRMSGDRKDPYYIEALEITRDGADLAGRLLRPGRKRSPDREFKVKIVATSHTLVMHCTALANPPDIFTMSFLQTLELSYESVLGWAQHASTTAPLRLLSAAVLFLRDATVPQTWEGITDHVRTLDDTQRSTLKNRYAREVEMRTDVVHLAPPPSAGGDPAD